MGVGDNPFERPRNCIPDFETDYPDVPGSYIATAYCHNWIACYKPPKTSALLNVFKQAPAEFPFKVYFRGNVGVERGIGYPISSGYSSL